jgi:hypothetical protein
MFLGNAQINKIPNSCCFSDISFQMCLFVCCVTHTLLHMGSGRGFCNLGEEVDDFGTTHVGRAGS